MENLQKAPRHDDDLVGTEVGGRWRVLSTIGEGGMAQVFAAEEIESGREVAIKILKKDIAQHDEAMERLRREGEVLSRIDNPAIVKVEHVGELENGRVYLVMELLKGESLGDRMARGPMEPRELTQIVTGAAAGLAAAHASDVVHRDLKPDNIFLCGDGKEMQVKLLDFGISKIAGFSDKLTQTGQVLGTPRYMAPEQLSADDLDPRVDVYAMGIMLYEGLAGQPPFTATVPAHLIVAILKGDAPPLAELRPDLHEGLVAVVEKGMARYRGDRYRTPMELAEDWLDNISVSGHPRALQQVNTSVLGGATRATPADQPDPYVDTAPLDDDTFSHPPSGDSLMIPGQSRWPVLAAVIAGALTAALAIGGYAYWSSERTEVENITPETTEPAEGTEVVGTTSPEIPEGVHHDDHEAEAGAASAEVTEPANDEPRRQVRRRRRTTAMSDVMDETMVDMTNAMDGDELPDLPPPPGGGMTAPPPPDLTSMMDSSMDSAMDSAMESAMTSSMMGLVVSVMMDEREPRTVSQAIPAARAALRARDPRRCLEVLAPYGRRLPAPGLRLKADCQLAAGNRNAARASYERYCRVFHDGSSIGDVRRILTRLGGTCD